MTLDHSLEKRFITDILIESSDENSLLDHVSTLKNVIDVSAEALLGWESIVSSPKYLVRGSGQSKRRKCVDQAPLAAPGCQENNKVVVRCVGDDFDERPVASWKANVEQGTYRYIPNNGCYRTMKFMDDNRNDWYTVNRKLPERISLSWQHKRMQKELKKQIKKELEKSCCDTKDATKSDDVRDVENVDGHSNIRPATDYVRIHSTHSENTHNFGSKIYRLEDDQIAPTYGLHHRGRFSKSVSDLFIESLSSRMNVLDEELKRDSQFIRKSQDESSKSSNKQKSRDKNKENTPRTLRKETLAQEIFTVKAVGTRDVPNRPDLRPLEKLTPQQRLVGDVHNLSLAQFRYNHYSSDEPANHPSAVAPQDFAFGGPVLEKTLNSYHAAIENSKQSLLNTLSGTKIHTSGIGRGKTKGMTSATAVTICDGLTSTDDPSIPTQVPQELVQNGSILPQVSGKRLEVVNSSHRWL